MATTRQDILDSLEAVEGAISTLVHLHMMVKGFCPHCQQQRKDTIDRCPDFIQCGDCGFQVAESDIYDAEELSELGLGTLA